MAKERRCDGLPCPLDEREVTALGLFARGLSGADVASEMRMHPSAFAGVRRHLSDKLNALAPSELRRVTLRCLLADA